MIHRIAFALVLLAFGSAALAQNPYTPTQVRTVYPPYPVYPSYGGYGWGGLAMGNAEAIRATGELMVSQEQARITREQANQAKLETKRKAFDEMMYEKANKATFTETQEYEKGVQLYRLMSDPLPGEVTNGQTLNAMLPEIKKMSVRGIHGPPVPIDQEQLKHLNVTDGKGNPSAGMIKGGGADLSWPLVLLGPKQEKLAEMLPQAVSEASMGKLDPKSYRELTVAVADLRSELRQKFHKEKIDGGEFLDGQRFLDSLDKSVQVLRSPNGQKLLTGTLSAKGRNVQELVDHMTLQGLVFAPANFGDEPAYRYLHYVFVSYTANAAASGGMHVRFQPPRTEAYQNK